MNNYQSYLNGNPLGVNNPFQSPGQNQQLNGTPSDQQHSVGGVPPQGPTQQVNSYQGQFSNNLNVLGGGSTFNFSSQSMSASEAALAVYALKVSRTLGLSIEQTTQLTEKFPRVSEVLHSPMIFSQV